MTKHRQNEKNHLSSFITKLLKLLQDSRYKNFIGWTADGQSITIDSHDELLQTSLSKYFNHTKISSFVRQLNLYGFKKVSARGSRMMYQHQYFIKGKTNLQMLIKRKRKVRMNGVVDVKMEEEGQNSMLKKEQNKIKGLQNIYARIRTQNQRIKDQTKEINLMNETLIEIRKSPFFSQLKRESTQAQGRNQQNSLNPSRQPKSQSSNSQNSTPDPQNTNQNRYQNITDYFITEQNKQSSDNQMGMFREDYQELSCEKMGIGNEEEASFWKKDRMKCRSEN